MSDDLGQAVGAILGISIGGWMLLEIGAELNSSAPIDFTVLGAIFILTGVLATVLLVYVLIASLK
jgi:ABC-type antimicrobial peptide transport system permease subunit